MHDNRPMNVIRGWYKGTHLNINDIVAQKCEKEFLVVPTWTRDCKVSVVQSSTGTYIVGDVTQRKFEGKPSPVLTHIFKLDSTNNKAEHVLHTGHDPLDPNINRSYDRPLVTALDAQGKPVAVAPDDSRLRIIDVETGKEREPIISGHKNLIRVCALKNVGKETVVASASIDYKNDTTHILVHDLATHTVIAEGELPGAAIEMDIVDATQLVACVWVQRETTPKSPRSFALLKLTIGEPEKPDTSADSKTDKS